MKIKCVDNTGMVGKLLVGKEYDVLQVHSEVGAYTVMAEDGRGQPFRQDRFVVVENTLTLFGTKVKCVDAVGTALVEGQVYPVKLIYANGIELVGVVGLYAKHRFVSVDDTCPDTVPGLPRHLEAKAAKVAQAHTQAEDERKKEMDFFRASCQSHTCGKCGAPTPCNYHPTHPQGWGKV
jgi:hypothetical protein